VVTGTALVFEIAGILCTSRLADAGAPGENAAIGQFRPAFTVRVKLLPALVIAGNGLVIPVEIISACCWNKTVRRPQSSQLLIQVGVDKVQVAGSLHPEAQSGVDLGKGPDTRDQTVVCILVTVLVDRP